MVGDKPGGVALFRKGCRRHRCHACCGAEQELRRAIGTAHFSASDDKVDGSRQGSEGPVGVQNLRRLGRMPSTMLASDTRAICTHEGSCADGASGAAMKECDATSCGVNTLLSAQHI